MVEKKKESTMLIVVSWEVNLPPNDMPPEVVAIPMSVWRDAPSVADWLTDNFGYRVKSWERAGL